MLRIKEKDYPLTESNCRHWLAMERRRKRPAAPKSAQKPHLAVSAPGLKSCLSRDRLPQRNSTDSKRNSQYPDCVNRQHPAK